jgi:hypothetical protein
MGAQELSSLYQKLVFTVAYNFYGTVDEAQYIVCETFRRWSATGQAPAESTRVSLIRIAANLCMERGNDSFVKNHK